MRYNDDESLKVYYKNTVNQQLRMKDVAGICKLTAAQDWFHTQVTCNWPNFQVPKEQIKEYQNYWNEVCLPIAVARRLEGK